MGEAFLISGGMRSGKTTLLKQILAGFLSDGRIAPYGFHEECVLKWERREGYDIVARMGEDTMRTPFARRKERLSSGCLFSFDESAVKAVKQFHDQRPILFCPALAYFDEFGRLEEEGGGLWPLMENLVKRIAANRVPYAVIFSVRDENAGLLQRQVAKSLHPLLKLSTTILAPASADASTRFAADIAKCLSGHG
jgi:nucleoside-triphosphatase THEP1